jgi:hypothetical protein
MGKKEEVGIGLGIPCQVFLFVPFLKSLWMKGRKG